MFSRVAADWKFGMLLMSLLCYGWAVKCVRAVGGNRRHLEDQIPSIAFIVILEGISFIFHSIFLSFIISYDCCSVIRTSLCFSQNYSFSRISFLSFS